MATKARIDIVAADKTKRAFRSAEGSLKRFRTAALSVGSVLGVGLFTTAAKGAITFADSIDKAAKAAGVGTDFMQEMRFAGEQLGVSQRQVDEGFRRFTRRLGEFANSGAGPAAKAIKKLGIEIRDSQGDFRGSEVIFRDFARAMQGLESEAERGAVAAQIFGDDAGPKLRLLLDQGVEGIDRLGQEAKDIGAILSEEVITNAVEAKDAASKLSSVLGVQLATAFSNLAPVITAAANGLVKFSAILKKVFAGSAEQLTPFDKAIESTTDRIKFLRNELSKGRFSLFGSEKAQTQLIQMSDLLDRLSKQRDDFIEKEKGREGSEFFVGPIKIDVEPINLDSVIDTENLKRDIQGISARLNPMKAAAIKFNEELAKIEKSNLGAEEKIELSRKLEQEFAKATGSVKKFTDSTAELKALEDRLFPLQAAAKQFNRELKLIKESDLSSAKQEESVRRLTKSFSDATGQNKKLQKENVRLSEGAVDMGFAFSSAFEEAILDGEKFSDVLNGLLRDITQVVLRQAITQPLGTAIGTQVSQTFPAFASGTNFAPGGLAVVGERGPELVNVPRGSQVYPNGAGGTTVNIVNNTGEHTDVRRSNDASGRDLINVVIGEVSRSVSSGGQVSRAMQSTFGLRQQGVVRT